MRRPTAHPLPRPCHGYTLIEVLLVIVLMGLASALVVPSLGTTDVLRVQAAVRTIVSDLNFAQSDALARQRGRAIVFDIPHNSYSIVEVRGATLNPVVDTVYTVKLSNTRKFNDAQLVSAVFDSGSNTLVYDELGGPVTAPSTWTVPSCCSAWPGRNTWPGG